MASLLQQEDTYSACTRLYSAYPAPLTRRGNSGGQQLGRKPVHGFGPKRAWDGVAVLLGRPIHPLELGTKRARGIIPKVATNCLARSPSGPTSSSRIGKRLDLQDMGELR